MVHISCTSTEIMYILATVVPAVEFLYSRRLSVVEFQSLICQRCLYDLPELFSHTKSSENPLDVIGSSFHDVKLFTLSVTTEKRLYFYRCEQLDKSLLFSRPALLVVFVNNGKFSLRVE